MKAVGLLEYGGQLVFADVPTPTIARDEILVKIKSAAVNHLDLVEASGTARQLFPLDLPWIPGHEFSGVVEQIGSDVSAWVAGDAVFGTTMDHDRLSLFQVTVGEDALKTHDQGSTADRLGVSVLPSQRPSRDPDG